MKTQAATPVPLLDYLMQCHAGWAAFDINNDQDWLNHSPYGDLKAMIDPKTARVLEMVGNNRLSKPEARSRLSQARARRWLLVWSLGVHLWNQ